MTEETRQKMIELGNALLAEAYAEESEQAQEAYTPDKPRSQELIEAEKVERDARFAMERAQREVWNLEASIPRALAQVIMRNGGAHHAAKLVAELDAAKAKHASAKTAVDAIKAKEEA